MNILFYLKVYGLVGICRLCYFRLRTLTVSSDVRLIRFPIEIRNKRQIHFGKRLTTGRYCRFEAWPYLKKDKLIILGNNVEIGDFVHIAAINKVKIGNNVLIASKVFISDINHGNYQGNRQTSPYIHPKDRELSFSSVIIEDDVWIGESVSILPGVIIGKGSIIGANTVITKSIPPNVIAVGNPATPIKYYNEDMRCWLKFK